MRHIEVRDITTDLLTEVCHGVGIKPHLQPITEEHLSFRTANREDKACLDMLLKTFWGEIGSVESTGLCNEQGAISTTPIF